MEHAIFIWKRATAAQEADKHENGPQATWRPAWQKTLASNCYLKLLRPR